MAGITAALVKELRERTGAGMMECKKALVDVGGDIEAAVEHMRKAGMAKADKKAGRVAAEGLIAIAEAPGGACAAMVEVNCETDFVAKNEDFKEFAENLAQLVLERDPADLDALLAEPMSSGESVDHVRRTLVARIGENLAVRRFARLQTDSGRIGSYLHGTRIGVLVQLAQGDGELARDLAMHVAASRPQFVRGDDVPAEILDKERDILLAQARESGKPENILEKMVGGRLRKFLAEITLLGQPFVKDPDQSVEKLLRARGGEVLAFQRFELGEGIEKRADDFASEVMAQARGG